MLPAIPLPLRLQGEQQLCLDAISSPPPAPAGRPYACEQSMEDVALDMFLKGLLVVEGGTAEPRDAAPAQLQWDDSARCYLPDMYNAEVSQGVLGTE